MTRESSDGAGSGELRVLVDHHQHLFSPATVALVAPPSGSPSGIRPIAAADLIRLLDDAGIARALVLSMGYTWGSPNRTVEDEYAKVKAENDWTSAQMALYPERLRGFCGVNPLREYALDEIARCAGDSNLSSGLKLHFGNSVVDLRDPEHIARLQRVFGAADGYGMAILVHMRASISRGLPYGREEARIFLDEVLPAAPDVAVQIGHLAGAGGYDDPPVDEALSVFVEAIERGDSGAARLWFDVASVAGNEVGSPVTNADLIARRLRQLGLHRVVFGSDAATSGNLAPRESWRRFQELPLTEDEFETIAGNVAPYAE